MDKLYSTPDVAVGVSVGVAVGVAPGVAVEVATGYSVGVGVAVGEHIVGLNEGALNVSVALNTSINAILVLTPPVVMFCEAFDKVPESTLVPAVQFRILYLYEPTMPEIFRSSAFDSVARHLAEPLFIYPPLILSALTVNVSGVLTVL